MAQLSPAQIKTMLDNRWFGRLPEIVRQEVLDRARLRHLKNGEVLFFKGQAPDGWYAVVEGAIKTGSTSPDGKEAILTFVEPGTWFGEISLFDGLPRTHDNTAHGDTTVLVVSITDFRAALSTYPVLYSHFMELHCQRIRLMFAAMEEWNTLPLEDRLMRQLRHLADVYGKPCPEGIEINLHLPQEDLAQLLGVTRQRVNQSLKSWERSGWVQFHYGNILLTRTLLDMSPDSRPWAGSSKRNGGA